MGSERRRLAAALGAGGAAALIAYLLLARRNPPIGAASSTSPRTTTAIGATTPRSTAGRTSRDAWSFVERMGVGINVNWVSFDWMERYYSRAVCEDFVNVGFRHIRLRIPLEKIGEKKQLIERVVRDCTSLDAIVVASMGPGALETNPTPSNVQLFVEGWGRLAEMLHGYPYELLAYDLIIEAGKALGERPDVLNEAQLRAWQRIRSIDRARVVFFAPPHTDNPLYLDLLRLPNDPLVAAEFHFCAAGASPKRKSCKWTTGTPQERAAIERLVYAAVKWRTKTHRPVWMGAWMPCSYNKGCLLPIQQQVAFATFLCCLLLRNHIPHAVNADQQYYDIRTRRWRQDRLPVLEAILHPRCT